MTTHPRAHWEEQERLGDPPGWLHSLGENQVSTNPSLRTQTLWSGRGQALLGRRSRILPSKPRLPGKATLSFIS